MHALTVAILIAAGVVAVVDWVAVTRRPSRVEIGAKPLTLALLVAAAITIDPTDGTQRAWFVTALVLSLAGDVFLLPQVDRFVDGLAAFLLAHLAYVAGFVAGGLTAVVVPIAIVGVAVVAVPLASKLVRGAIDVGHRELVAPVIAYVVVISAMVVAAVASRNAIAIVGAVAFMGSDAVIGWSRFVRPFPGAPLVIMVSYHVGQALLVASLA